MDLLTLIVDFILHVDVHLQELMNNYGLWVYGILFLIIFSETGLVVTPFLPGDSLLFAAGAISALGNMNIHLMVVILLAAAILGDAVNFAIGKYFGEKLFSNPNSKVFKQEYLEKTHKFYEKYGGKTIIISRFVPIVRTFAPFVAGMGNMHYGRFLQYNVIGAVLWVVSLSYAGYFFGDLPFVKNNFGMVVIGIIVVSVLPMVFEIVRAKMGNKEKA